MEELIKLHSEVKQYCVYAHYYENQLFYIGSGEVYRNSRGLSGRPFNFSNRNENWLFFCNGEKDKVTVEILFVTNDQKLSFDKEEEITRMYMEKGFSLANKNIGNRHSEERKRKLREINKRKNNTEELIKLYSEVKQYCVYAHYYNDELFYIGSGEVYKNKSGLLRGRPFDFNGRSEEWFKFCNWEKDKVTVEILFVANDEKLSLDKEEEITRYYMELEMPLVNVRIGNKMSEEQKKQHSIVMSGKNHPFYGKALSEEHRKKISEANKGKALSEEHRKKISEANKRRIFSEETRNKMSEARKGKNNPFYGKPLSVEHRNKISEAHKGKILSEETKIKIHEGQKGEKNHMWGKRGEDNPNYGSKRTLEQRKRMSEAQKGKKGNMWGKKRSVEVRKKISKNNARSKKVLVINNKSGESKVFDSITRFYEFISQNGFDKSKNTLNHYLNKGQYNFNEYTFEIIA